MNNLRASAAALLWLLWLLCGNSGIAAAASVPDTIEQRVAACIACHGREGASTNAGFFPRLAGKPAGYLYNQLLSFRDGRRFNADMTNMVQFLSDAYLREMAEYFAALDLPYPRVASDSDANAETLLYPAFPYTSFTNITREDSDAIYAWLRSLPPVAQPNAPHRLRFPYNTQAALAVWRAVSFTPGAFVPDPAKPAEWNRGAYLVDGLGHCIACHGGRNVLGAVEEKRGLAGGSIPVENWAAPSLTSPRKAGVTDWDTQHVIALLKTGSSPRGSVIGPMAEVVYRSTQYLAEADLAAIALYLKQLPPDPPPPPARSPQRDAGTMARGAKIYDQRCAYCHGDAGEGAPGAYPPLAGSRAVNMASPTNLIQVVRHGGFLPATEGNPRPYGMPPFNHVLDDNDIGAVLSYIRGSWGNDAEPVSQRQTMRR